MEHRIAEQEVGVRSGLPGREIALDECAARQPLARLAEHVGRGVDADHLGIGKPLDQQFGRVARPAAEIDQRIQIFCFPRNQLSHCTLLTETITLSGLFFSPPWQPRSFFPFFGAWPIGGRNHARGTLSRTSRASTRRRSFLISSAASRARATIPGSGLWWTLPRIAARERQLSS
jgi:hypothetical protein